MLIKQLKHKGVRKMNTVLIIPTGIEAKIGGHCGDANPVAKLLASCSENLITHPNVVNASDINEMTENTLYVEGSMIDRFLAGEIELQKVKKNKVLLVINETDGDIINAVSAARVTIGLDVEITILKTPLRLIPRIENNEATGDVLGWKELVEQIKDYDFDALAINSPVETSPEVALNYFKNGGINPWGGVEAECSRLISKALNKPVAHSPTENYKDIPELFLFSEVVDPRIAPEMVSMTYLHCILKGLHKAPRIGKGLSCRDVDVMVSPYGIFGRPHIACKKNHIPIIYVEENTTSISRPIGYSKNDVIVKNYLEAVGVIQAMKIGITLESVRRPIRKTRIIE